MTPGEQGCAFTYFSDRRNLRLIFVPVTATGTGNAGVVDSGNGPNFDEGTDTVVATDGSTG